MASFSGGFSQPIQWNGPSYLLQNWLHSISPEYKAQQAQIAKENAFRQQQLDISRTGEEASAGAARASTAINQEQLRQMVRQNALSQLDLGGWSGQPKEATPVGNDVGQEQGPSHPASGAQAVDSEPTTMQTQEPSSQKSTTLPAYDPNEFLSSQIARARGPKYDPNTSMTDQITRGFTTDNTEPSFSSTSSSRFGGLKPRIPGLIGAQKASNSMPDVPSSAAPAQPDSGSLGSAQRLNAIPSATTASSASAGGDAGPSTNSMQFGTHKSVPYTQQHDASTAWEELSDPERSSVVNYANTQAPEGVKFSPAEVQRAYRIQHFYRTGSLGAAPAGTYLSQYEVGPDGLPKATFKANAFGEGAGGMNPEGLEIASKVQGLNKPITEDENMKNAQSAIKTYGDMLSQAELAKKSGGKSGVNDKTLAQKYLQLVAPNARFNEQTQELIGDTHNIPDKVRSELNRALTGTKMLDETREQLLASAAQIAQNAHNAAVQSTANARSLGDVALGHQRAMQWLTQVPEVPNTGETTGTAPRVGDGTVLGSSEGVGTGGYKTISTKKDWQDLTPGTKFIWGPTGQKGTR